jgi:hypothetical protein
MPTQYANLTKNSSVPDVAGGVLWQDEVNKVFWLYGGEFADVPSTFELWGYDVILNQWNLSSPTITSTSPIQRVSYGAGVAVSELGMGFYYGGYLNNQTNPAWNGPQIATNNLITFDMDAPSLTNSSGYGDSSTGRAEGTMVYIPTSGEGLLVYFGGVTFPYGNETEVAVRHVLQCSTLLLKIATDLVIGAHGSDSSLRHWRRWGTPDICFLMCANPPWQGNWHTQTATGYIPEMRRKSCGGVIWPADHSSYNV